MKHFLFFMLTLIFNSSCSTIFEKNLSEEVVVIVSPSDNVQTYYYNQHFRWEKIEGAGRYRLQIAYPSFDDMQQFVLDTTITGTQVLYTLDPGSYEWRVRAENSAYETPYTLYHIKIDTASLSMQQPVQIIPEDGVNKTNALINFRWYSIFGVTDYFVEIDTITGDFSMPLKSAGTGINQYNYSIINEGLYIWRVRGTDGTTNTKWSEVWQFSYDKTAPSIVTLLAPEDGATKSKPVTFSWNTISNVDHYEFYLYKSDGVTLYTTVYPVQVSGDSYLLNAGNSGETLYWTVVAVDAAGNKGPKAIKRSVKIQ